MSYRTIYQQAALATARRALKLAPRCGATCKRTGLPCRSPAMANGRCRMHGGKSPGAPSAEGHWNFKHGGRTQTEAQSVSRMLRKARTRRQDGRALAELMMLLKEARRRGQLPGDLPERIRRLVDELE